MSIALRHRVERLEKFLQARERAVDQRKGFVSHLAKMFGLEESEVEGIWDRTVGDATLIPESANALMDEIHRECNPPPDRETLLRRQAEMRD